MKLNINTAIDILLTLPSHKSRDDSHKKIGDITLEFLLEYKNIECDVDREFNREIIALILSCTRIETIERSKLEKESNNSYNTLDIIANNINSFLKPFSITERGQYSLLIPIIQVGLALIKDVSVKNFLQKNYILLFIICLILQQSFIFIVGFAINKLSNHKEKEIWEEKTQEMYENIITYFIEHYIDIHKKYYSDTGILINSTNESKSYIIDTLLNKHLYARHMINKNNVNENDAETECLPI